MVPRPLGAHYILWDRENPCPTLRFAQSLILVVFLFPFPGISGLSPAAPYPLTTRFSSFRLRSRNAVISSASRGWAAMRARS